MIFGGERFPIKLIKQILKYLNKTEIYNDNHSALNISKRIKKLKNIPI